MLYDINEEWSCWVVDVTCPQLSHGMWQVFLSVLIHVPATNATTVSQSLLRSCPLTLSLFLVLGASKPAGIPACSLGSG